MTQSVSATDTNDPDRSLFDSIAELLPVDQRPHFYRRMAHFRHLEPTDDMLHLAEAMGFLALITRETPGQIALERAKIERVLRDGVADVARSIHHESIAEGLSQQFNEAGLRDTAALLTSRAAELSSACSEFSAAIQRLSDSDSGATHRITRSLALMQTELANASEHVRILVTNLRSELRSAIAVIAIAALLSGFLSGLLYARYIHL